MTNDPLNIAALLQHIAELNRQLPALSESERNLAASLVAKIAPGKTPISPNPEGCQIVAATNLNLQNLKASWKEPAWRTGDTLSPLLHVFIGGPGCGKTACLSKWLAQEVLLGGRAAQVWRLDGVTANTAEALSIQAEVLGVPVARAWSGETGWEIGFVDLPGTDWRDPAALDQLGAQIVSLKPAGDSKAITPSTLFTSLPSVKPSSTAQVHLVLNLAYDTAVLLEQVRAFSGLPIADLIFTHLDEEERRGKILEFVLATQYPISFLSAGQNVPGCFQVATAEAVWAEIYG